MPARLLLPVLLVACDSTPTDSGGDPSLSATAALAEAIPTVLVVDYTAPSGAADVWVEWGLTDSFGHRTRVGAGGTGRGAVVGLHAETDYTWRLVAEVDGAELTSEAEVVHTGPGQQFIGDLTVASAGDPTFGYFLTTTLGHDANVVMFDAEGAPVWWLQAGEGAVFSEVRLMPDGRGVLLQQMDGYRESDIGAVLAYAWDGTLLSNTRTPGAHHDFVVGRDGRYAYCSTDTRMTDVDGVETSVVGEALREVPAGGAEADIVTVWTSWDTLPVRVDAETDSGFYPEGLDWVHCNGLAYLPESDDYLMSAYELRSVLQIDAASGALDWVFGGFDNQFDLEGTRNFREVHSPEPVEGGFRLFINRSGDPLVSRVGHFELDTTTMVATELPSIELDGEYYSYILGDSNAIPGGNTLVSWGSAGVFTEVDADGALVWSGSAGIGTIVGFSELVAAPGGPL